MLETPFLSAENIKIKMTWMGIKTHPATTGPFHTVKEVKPGGNWEKDFNKKRQLCRSDV